MKHQLRTNHFEFDPGELSPVYQYHATPELKNAWKVLMNLLDSPYLATHGLQELLCLASGGPVWVNSHQDPALPVIASLQSIPYDRLCRAVDLWVKDLLRDKTLPHADFLRQLYPQKASGLSAEELLSHPDKLPCARKAISWMLSERMAGAMMESTVPLKLSLCSDSTLLAWDNPLVYSMHDRKAFAMHAITPELSFLRGNPTPYISLRVHLSHILSKWRYPTQKAWIKTDRGIAKLDIYITPKIEGQHQTLYRTAANRLAELMGEPPLPALGGDSIPLEGMLRPIHSRLPQLWPMGRGTGPLFLDQASFHIRKTLPSAQPMVVTHVGNLVAKPSPPTKKSPKICIAVVTAHSDVMARVSTAYENLEQSSAIFAEVSKPEVQLVQIQCPGSMSALTFQTTADDIVSWFRSELLQRLDAIQAQVAIIETTPAVASRNEADPKHVLRTLCAKHGIPTQFLMHHEREEDCPPSDDYPATNGLIDALRGYGYVPKPLQRTRQTPEHTAVVSIYLAHTRRGGDLYLPVITRTWVGTQRHEVFWPASLDDRVVRGTNHDATIFRTCWHEYKEGLCAIHAQSDLLPADEAKKIISRALLAPTAVADTPLIVFISDTAKYLYPGLDQVGTGALPPVPEDAWLIRVRADEETALMTGNHSESPNVPRYIGSKMGVYQAGQQPGLYYFTSFTKTYNSIGSQRKQTRYDLSPARLRDPWQQLGVSELVIIKPGDFSSPDGISLQTGLWCKQAPLWDGYLRLPSPMHAAKQIALDHPMIERGHR